MHLLCMTHEPPVTKEKTIFNCARESNAHKRTFKTTPKLTISVSKKHSESFIEVSSQHGPHTNQSCLQLLYHCNMCTITGSINIYLGALVGSTFGYVLIILGRPWAISPDRPCPPRGSFRFLPNL